MKIATWNVERLKHRQALDEILRACEHVQADILVLTETDERLNPNYNYCFRTPTPGNLQPQQYRPTENRVSIFTNYPCVRQHNTYDKYTALCVELMTERGNLLVYGTIIGIYGNRHAFFKHDLLLQTEDFQQLSVGGKNLCICGDFNCSFADNYYYTMFGRTVLLQSLRENRINLLTADRSECIDHIAISEAYVGTSKIQIQEWNLDKRLSDHKGITVEII